MVTERKKTIQKMEPAMNKKLSKKQKIILLIDLVAVILSFAIIGIVTAIREQNRAAAEAEMRNRHAQYKVIVDGTENGEIAVVCKTKDDNKTCEPIEITGSYEQSSESFPLESNTDGLNAENGQFKLNIQAEAGKSDEQIKDQEVTLSFKEDGNVFYRYTLLVHINLDENSKQILKAAEEKKAAEEAAEAARKEAEAQAARKEAEAQSARKEAEARAAAHINSLKSCSIPTSQWTDNEAVQYMSEYIACHNRELENEKKDWENTAPSQLGTRSLCRQALEANYPYGTKIHSILGVIADTVESANSRFYKVEVDITNAFGATRSTVMECRVVNAGNNMIKIDHFYVY